MHHDTTYTNLTTDTVAICGIALYAEVLDWVIVGEIEPTGATGSTGATGQTGSTGSTGQ